MVYNIHVYCYNLGRVLFFTAAVKKKNIVEKLKIFALNETFQPFRALPSFYSTPLR